MLKRNIFIAAGVAALLIAFVLLFFFVFKPGMSFEKSNAFRAVPENSPMFLKINKPVQFFSKLSNNEMAGTLMLAQTEITILKKVESAYSYLASDENFIRLLRNNELIIALNYSGRDNIDPLFIIPLKSKNDADLLSRIINHVKNEENIKSETRKYNRVDIHQLNINNNTVYLTIHEGLCLISDKSLLIEDAIRQTNSISIDENPELEPLIKTASSQADINLFVNHSNADRLLSKYAASHLSSKAALLKTYSGWSELDFNISNDRIILGGFTAGSSIENFYANALYNQQALQSRIDRVLPQSTSFYVSLTLSNIRNYINDYQEYLKKRNLFFQREDQLKRMERETGSDLSELFIDIADQEIAMAGIITDQNTPLSGRIWVVNTKSGSQALARLVELQANYIKRHNVNQSEWTVNYSVDRQTEFTIYRFPYPTLPAVLFGQTFSGVQATWFAQYENYIIFGDSHRTVSRALHSNVLGETLSGSMDYNRFKSNMNSRANFTFYTNTNVSLPIASALFNNKTAKLLSDNEDLRKFRAAAWQVSSSGNMLYNNACLLYNPEVKSKPQTIWQSNIGSTFDFKPKFVINHNDRQNREMVLVDNKNNFYLINNVGRILWQIKLDSPVLGDVHQIDFFKNGRLQYVFNTENRIYLIDRNGNNVGNYPVTLRAKATNGMSVFDYTNSRDYRFFVACADRNIYAYSPEGNLLNGWNIFRTDHIVTHPIQHFRIDGMDFIVASDKMRDYILHRRGTLRVNTSAVYEHSPNNPIYLEDRSPRNEPRLVATDTDGNLHYTYLDDGKHEMVTFDKMNEDHFFVAENLSGTGGVEYIFANANQVIIYSNDGKVQLRKRMDAPVSHRPNIYTFSRGVKKVGITSKSINKISLFDLNGNMHPGFPLDGSTEFSIGFISSEMSNFNLLVGSPDGFLYNYYVE